MNTESSRGVQRVTVIVFLLACTAVSQRHQTRNGTLVFNRTPAFGCVSQLSSFTRTLFDEEAWYKLVTLRDNVLGFWNNTGHCRSQIACTTSRRGSCVQLMSDCTQCILEENGNFHCQVDNPRTCWNYLVYIGVEFESEDNVTITVGSRPDTPKEFSPGTWKEIFQVTAPGDLELLTQVSVQYRSTNTFQRRPVDVNFTRIHVLSVQYVPCTICPQ